MAKKDTNVNSGEKTQVNPMVFLDTEIRIRDEAARRNISPTTLCGQILDKYAHYLLDKEIRGDLMLGKRVLELMLECETDEEYQNNSKKAATYIDTETKAQVKKKVISYEERLDRIKAWHELNGFRFNDTEDDGVKRWFVVHHCGIKWSKFQCMLIQNLLKYTGMDIGNVDHDDLSFWIEFKKNTTFQDL